MKRFPLHTILLSLLLVSCSGVSAGAQPDEPSFVVIAENPDDQVELQFQDNAAWIDIHSPTGIGSASFELVSGTMPQDLTLRLHLSGLEEFRLISSRDRIAASVPSSSSFTAGNQTILSSGSESSLLPGHPLWMQIEIVAGADKTVPLEEGYFEIQVPGEFIRNAGTTFEIEWIDFYR